MTVNAEEVVSSNLVVTNYGTGPALSVTQSETGVLGPQAVATFTAGSNVGLVVTSSGNVAVGKGTAAYALDVSGAVSATSFVGSGALLTGISSGGGGGMFKNLVINGDMQINQYWLVGTDVNGSWNAITSLTGSTASSQATSCYIVDRWCVFQDGYVTGAHYTQGWWNNTTDGNSITTASTNLPFSDSGILYYAMIGRYGGSSTANINLRYAFELTDSYQLYGKAVTLSFYYQTGTNFSGSAINYGFIMGAGEGLQRGAVTITNTISSTASPSTTWVRASFTTTLPSITTSNLYLALFFSYTPSGTAGNHDYVSITGVQLEKGSSATSFEYCPIATKQMLCSRYYKSLNTHDVFMGLNNNGMMTFSIPTNMMRATTSPTIIYTTLPFVDAYSGVIQISSVLGAYSTQSTVFLAVSCSALSTNTGPLMLVNGVGGISAEM